jgi:hypothetical protein
MIYTVIEFQCHDTDCDNDLISRESVSVTLFSEMGEIIESIAHSWFNTLVYNHGKQPWNKASRVEFMIVVGNEHAASDTDIHFYDQTKPPRDGDSEDIAEHLEDILLRAKIESGRKWDAWVRDAEAREAKAKETAERVTLKKAELERLAKEEAERQLYQELKLKYEGPWSGMTGEAK